MEHLKLAANLNTRANQLLLNGDAASAFGQYRNAIRLLAECQRAAAKNNVPQVQETSPLLSAFTVAGQVSVTRKTLAYPHEAHEEASGSFSSPLYEVSLLPSCSDSEWTLNELAHCSSVVIYNCAVCVHQRGGWAGLQKAHTLYAQCLELLQPIVTCEHSNQLLASVLQNQANIFYNLDDFASVRCIKDKLFLLQQQNMIEKSGLSKDIHMAPEA